MPQMDFKTGSQKGEKLCPHSKKDLDSNPLADFSVFACSLHACVGFLLVPQFPLTAQRQMA